MLGIGIQLHRGFLGKWVWPKNELVDGFAYFFKRLNSLTFSNKFKPVNKKYDDKKDQNQWI